MNINLLNLDLDRLRSWNSKSNHVACPLKSLDLLFENTSPDVLNKSVNKSCCLVFGSRDESAIVQKIKSRNTGL